MEAAHDGCSVVLALGSTFSCLSKSVGSGGVGGVDVGICPMSITDLTWWTISSFSTSMAMWSL